MGQYFVCALTEKISTHTETHKNKEALRTRTGAEDFSDLTIFFCIST